MKMNSRSKPEPVSPNPSPKFIPPAVDDWGDREEALASKAESLQGDNVDVLVEMSMAAYEERRDKTAMKIFSASWGRNARHLATAVARWYDWFSSAAQISDGREIVIVPRRAQSVGEVLSLWEIAKLSAAEGEVIYQEWQRRGLNFWQVQERVANAKANPAGSKRVRLALKDVKLEVHPSHLKIDRQGHYVPTEYAGQVDVTISKATNDDAD